MPYEIKTIPPIPSLAELREEVLKHSLKRMPKWKFRLAPDLVLQLQPKPTIMLSEAAVARGIKPKLQHFEGLAVMMASVTGDVFKRLPPRAAPPFWQIKFELYAFEPGADWMFRRTGGRWHWDAGYDGVAALAQRVIAVLGGGFFTAAMPVKMLSHSCIICGKVLTDPASMARWIGPECSGTSSLRVPFVIDTAKSIAA